MTRGEVDAGFVYATDASLVADRLQVLLEVPLAESVTYPIVVKETARNSVAACRFITYLLSPEGQRILAGYGFSAR